MTNSNPKSLLKLYKYNTLFSSAEIKGVKPNDEKPGENIRCKEVKPMDTPQKKAPEESPIKDTPGEGIVKSL